MSARGRAIPRALTLAGLVALAFAAGLSAEALSVVFGRRAVAPGGGEFFLALFGGLPSLGLAVLLLGTCTLRASWRSALAVLGLAVAVLLACAWVVAALRWP